MGEVYRARDTRLDREVALKILPPALAIDAERVTRFTREAKSLAALSHPHIAQIYGLEDTGETRALVMELVPGETLAARLLRGTPPLREALDMARQIADGLAAAHERGIIHRDLKPANIQVTPDGVVKILDFGLAKVLAPPGGDEAGAVLPATMVTQMTAPGAIVGTAAYLSPEQARGQAVDCRTDVWAFGCVLFELLAGSRAFVGLTVPDILVAVLEREPQLGSTTGLDAARSPVAGATLPQEGSEAADPRHGGRHVRPRGRPCDLSGAADVGAATPSSPTDAKDRLALGGEDLQSGPPTRVTRAPSALLRGATLKVALLAVVALIALGDGVRPRAPAESGPETTGGGDFLPDARIGRRPCQTPPKRNFVEHPCRVPPID